MTISKLMLGTVQFGMNYGINNKYGQPSLKDALEMLSYSFEKGVRDYDTAMAYGNAEEVLGEFIKKSNLSNEIKIVSKLKPNIFDESKSILLTIEEEASRSIEKLNINSLDGYLLHTPEYVYNDDIIYGLSIIKKKGLVKNIGVSIYNEKEALYAANLPSIDYIQIPYSIFDQRLHKTDFFSIAKKNKKVIHARSVFVQGLLLMDPQNVPSHLSMASSKIEKLGKMANYYQINIAQLALQFSLQNIFIDKVIFGVDHISQLIDNLNYAEKEYMNSSTYTSLKDEFNNIDSYVVIPSLWKK